MTRLQKYHFLCGSGVSRDYRRRTINLRIARRMGPNLRSGSSRCFLQGTINSLFSLLSTGWFQERIRVILYTNSFLNDRSEINSVQTKPCIFIIQMDRYKNFFEIASHSYDEVNMRTRSVEEIEVGKERDYYDVIHLYSTVCMTCQIFTKSSIWRTAERMT